jgi:uncharacterized phage protein (TIGR02218 family)
MTYSAQEISTSDGRPVELYRFNTGGGLQFAYTNAEVAVIDDALIEYVPGSLRRGQPTQSTEKTATQMTVTLPYQDDNVGTFAQLTIDDPPEGKTTLTIQRVHLTDSGNEFVVFWTGAVLSSAFNGDGEVELLCRGIKNIFQREGPRMSYGGTCQHILYDVGCGLAEVAFTDAGVIVTDIASDGVTLTLSGLSATSYLNGKIEKDGGADNRLIVGHSGNQVTIQYPFRSDFAVGDIVSLTQGCDHIITGDCLNQFANTDNFGGAPYTPGLNPWAEGLDKL